MNSVLKPRLPWRPAALIASALLAVVFAVAPARASQALARPALAHHGVIQALSGGAINADGIQGSGA